MTRFPFRTLLVALLGLLTACSGESRIPLDPPAGWTTDERGRWWTPGADTSSAFRDLETLEAMGVVEETPVYEAGVPASAQSGVGRARLLYRLRRELLPLYRNRPGVVDSLFVRYVEPKIRSEDLSGDADEAIARFEREAYRTIMRHFRPPAARTVLGRDVPVPIPDSLRETGGGRLVTFQVLVDDTGAPVAMWQLEGIHPVLDRIALQAVSQVTWQPAYLLGTTRAHPIEAWVRFSIRFP